MHACNKKVTLIYFFNTESAPAPYGNEFRSSSMSNSSQGVRVGKRSVAMSWANYNNLIIENCYVNLL